MSNKEGKTIYDLELHESMEVNSKGFNFYLSVMRVPSGFIYTYYDTQPCNVSHSVFVPYDNSFQKVEDVSKPRL